MLLQFQSKSCVTLTAYLMAGPKKATNSCWATISKKDGRVGSSLLKWHINIFQRNQSIKCFLGGFSRNSEQSTLLWTQYFLIKNATIKCDIGIKGEQILRALKRIPGILRREGKRRLLVLLDASRPLVITITNLKNK